MKQHYVATYDNGTGYREFGHMPTPDKEEAEKEASNIPETFIPKVEKAEYDQEQNQWKIKD